MRVVAVTLLVAVGLGGPPTAVPAPAVAQSPTISLDPTSGLPGATVTVTGDDWPEATTLQLYFDQTDPDNQIPPLLTFDTDDVGAFTVQFTVPGDRQPGTYTVMACADCGTQDVLSATAPFTLQAPPAIALEPASGRPGDTIAVTGTAWIAGLTAEIYLDQDDPDNGVDPVATATAGDDGTFATSFQVPADRPAGAYTVLACQDCQSEGPVATKGFTLVAPPPAAISLDPASGSPGHTVTVSGTGWAPGSAVQVYLDEGDQSGGVDPVVSGAMPDAEGGFTASFVVPLDRDDRLYTVLACQGCSDGGLSATADFTLVALTPTLGLDPSAATPGDTVKVTGAEWAPKTWVAVYLDRLDPLNGVDAVASARTDEDGNLSTSFVMPDRGTGTDTDSSDAESSRGPGQPLTVLACQRCDSEFGPRATFRFTLLAPLPSPSPEQSPTAAAPSPASQSGPRRGVGLPALVIGLLVLALLAGLAFFLRQTARWRRPGWQRAAEDQDRAEPCQGRRWYCRRGDVQVDPALRRVAGVSVAIRVPGRDEPAKVLDVDQGVELLNHALTAQRARVTGAAASYLVDTATDVVWDEIDRELARGVRQDLEVELDLEASEATCPYTLFHCERSGVGRRWVERATWTGKVQASARRPVTTISVGTVEAQAAKRALSGALLEAIEAVALGQVSHRLKGSHELELSL